MKTGKKIAVGIGIAIGLYDIDWFITFLIVLGILLYGE